MRIPLDLKSPLHLDTAELRYPAYVISSQIHQHAVFGKLFRVREKFLLQCLVLLLRFPSGPCPRERKCVQHSAFELHQGLRRRACDLKIRACEVKHVRGRVHGPKYTVCVQQASLKFRLQPVRQHHLKDVPLENVPLCLFNHHAELIFREERTHRRGHFPRNNISHCPSADQLSHVSELKHGPVVGCLKNLLVLRQFHIHDKNQLLPIVVEADHLVKQHQVDILEALRVPGVKVKPPLRIFQVVVGEVPYQPARK